MDLTRNEQTFLKILQAALRGAKAAPADLAADMDWNWLIRMAVQHKLLPMIVSALPAELLPNARTLKQNVLRQVGAQTMKSSEFLALYTAMRDAGFHPLVVKGIVCRGIYPQGDLRPSSDEDLYVPDEEFAACCGFLRGRGMEPTGADDPDAYEIGWRKPGSQLYIELHRRLFPPDSRAYGDLEGFFDLSAGEAAVYPTELGPVVYSLSPHDHMLYLLLHAYKHFLHSGFGIRQVCDIGLWAREYRDRIDWDRLARQCEACNAQKFAAAVLGIASYDLDISAELPPVWQAPEDFCRPLLADVLTGGIYGASDSDRQHSSTVTLQAVEADRSGLRSSIWKSVFLNLADMEKKYPYLKKYPMLLPAAWIQRIFRYLKEKRDGGSPISASITIGNERVRLLRLYGIIR